MSSDSKVKEFLDGSIFDLKKAADPDLVSRTPVQAFQGPEVKTKRFKDFQVSFCSRVSLDGLDKLVDSEYGYFRRAVWFLCILTLLGFGLFQAGTQVQKFRGRPVNVLVNITREKSMEFPAITVCNFNIYQLGKVEMGGAEIAGFVKQILFLKKGFDIDALAKAHMYDFDNWNWNHVFSGWAQRLNESLLKVSF